MTGVQTCALPICGFHRVLAREECSIAGQAWAGAGTRSAKSKAAMRTRFRRIDLGIPKQ